MRSSVLTIGRLPLRRLIFVQTIFSLGSLNSYVPTQKHAWYAGSNRNVSEQTFRSQPLETGEKHCT
jgi:hypothetical protein